MHIQDNENKQINLSHKEMIPSRCKGVKRFKQNTVGFRISEWLYLVTCNRL